MFPFSLLAERIDDTHPTHGILLRRLEIQMANQFRNPLSCDTLPFSLLLQLSVAYLLDPTISDGPQLHRNGRPLIGPPVSGKTRLNSGFLDGPKRDRNSNFSHHRPMRPLGPVVTNERVAHSHCPFFLKGFRVPPCSQRRHQCRLPSYVSSMASRVTVNLTPTQVQQDGRGRW